MVRIGAESTTTLSPPWLLCRVLLLGLDTSEEARDVAKTDAGKKIVTVKEYKRAKPGGTYKKVAVKRHRRSTPD